MNPLFPHAPDILGMFYATPGNVRAALTPANDLDLGRPTPAGDSGFGYLDTAGGLQSQSQNVGVEAQTLGHGSGP